MRHALTSIISGGAIGVASFYNAGRVAKGAGVVFNSTLAGALGCGPEGGSGLILLGGGFKGQAGFARKLNR